VVVWVVEEGREDHFVILVLVVLVVARRLRCFFRKDADVAVEGGRQEIIIGSIN
jgi:hypothetical protein